MEWCGWREYVDILRSGEDGNHVMRFEDGMYEQERTGTMCGVDGVGERGAKKS